MYLFFFTKGCYKKEQLAIGAWIRMLLSRHNAVTGSRAKKFKVGNGAILSGTDKIRVSVPALEDLIGRVKWLLY